MKILVFCAFYLPYKGGYVVSIHELAKGLIKRGHNLTILACDTNKQNNEEVIDGVRIIRLPCWNPDWLNNSFPIPKPIKTLKTLLSIKEQFDLVSTQTRFFPTTFLGLIFAKLKKIPIIHTERGSQHTETNNLLIKIIGVVVDQIWGAAVCRFSDEVVGVSQAACDFCKKLGAKNPIKIYNGVDLKFWSIDKKIAKKGEPFTVTFVGRLVYAKGVQNLIEAISLLKNRNQQLNIKLNIIGNGPYRLVLENLVKDLKLEDRVVFLGEKTAEEIRIIFKQTDALVNPSYSEGLPRSVLEAGAAGLPVIATDVGGTREIINSPDCGFLIKFRVTLSLADGIEKLASNSCLGLRLGDNLKKRVKENFSNEQNYFNFNSILQTLHRRSGKMGADVGSGTK